jgi:hypothetical protein
MRWAMGVFSPSESRDSALCAHSERHSASDRVRGVLVSSV